MADPLTIERKYRTVRHTLSLLTGPRNRLLHVVEFAELLNDPQNRSFSPAYSQELLALLCKLIPQVEFAGISPDIADRTSRALEWLANLQAGHGEDERLEGARAHLRREKELVAERSAGRHTEAVSAAAGVYIPMVEQEYLVPAFTPRFASLCLLVVDLHLRSRPGRDEIHLAQLAPAEAHNRCLDDAMRAARGVLLRWKHISVPDAAVAHCSTGGNSVVEGGSLGAGLSVALVSQLLRAVMHREEFRPRGNVAFTGIVDGQGELLPIAEAGLKLKVEACLYSPIGFLVVPEAQRLIAEHHLRTLLNVPPSEEKRGDPPLTIIGVTRVEEIFYDRRLIDSRRVPAAVHFARRAWKIRRPLVVFLLVVLLAIIGRMWYGPLDRNPAQATFSGSVMSIRNRGGDIIQPIDVGYASVSIADGANNSIVDFLDIDGDGTDEIFWAQNGEGDSGAVGTIHCRGSGEEQDRWTKIVRKKLHFPLNPIEGDDFGVFSLDAGDFDGNGIPELLVVARHQDYPSFLLKLDARNGHELDSYVHAGHITRLAVMDLEGDGTNKILLTGVNNAFGEAFLAVLDPRSVTGHGPVRRRYVIEGVPPAHEQAYLLVPKTIVFEAFPDRVRWNQGLQVTYLASASSIRLALQEATDDARANLDIVKYYLILSHAMNPIKVQTGDNFDMLAERYLREGLIRKIPDKAYWGDYIKRIRFWDGKGWRNRVATKDLSQPEDDRFPER